MMKLKQQLSIPNLRSGLCTASLGGGVAHAPVTTVDQNVDQKTPVAGNVMRL